MHIRWFALTIVAVVVVDVLFLRYAYISYFCLLAGLGTAMQALYVCVFVGLTWLNDCCTDIVPTDLLSGGVSGRFVMLVRYNFDTVQSQAGEMYILRVSRCLVVKEVCVIAKRCNCL